MVGKYETLIEQLKKMMEAEKSNCFQLKTLYSREMESKKELERVLRLSIEDVREEINKKKGDSGVYKHIKKTALARMEGQERIVEVLMSQERVLTLLYDKTFPPKKELKSAQIELMAEKQRDTYEINVIKAVDE